VRSAKEVLAILEDTLDRQHPHVVIFDNTNMQNPSKEVRLAYTDFFKKRQADLSQYCLGYAFVMDAILLRMALRSVMMIARPPNPIKLMASVEEARAWADQLLQPTQGKTTMAQPPGTL